MILIRLTLIYLALLLQSMTVPAATPIPAPPAVNAKAFYIMDHNSGQVLAAKNESERLEPASITKLMTAYVVFGELANNRINLHELVTISTNAWRMPGSRMFIEERSKVSIEDLLKGMIIQSGNDASVALAEHVAGTEDAFVSMMNAYADQLGLADTRYQNTTGLPVADHYTTARDIAILVQALIRVYPDYYAWYSEKEFTYNNITQYNRNSLLWSDTSVDGVKTGHHATAGYCLVASAQRNNMRLIAVVLGVPNARARAGYNQALLNYGFRFYETHPLYAANEPISTKRVWKGTHEEVNLGLKTALYVTIERGRYEELHAEMEIPDILVAPLQSDQPLGQVRVTVDGELVVDRDLYALEPVELGGFWRRAVDEVMLWFE